MWLEIKRLTDQHGYMSGVNRMTDRVKETGEVFTPTDLVIEILQQMDLNQFAPGKTVIDPACGDGQFLVPVKWVKILHFNMTEQNALKDIYGVDIMRDNVEVCKTRLGGGNIMLGNTLEPNKRQPEQTIHEYSMVRDWFIHLEYQKLLRSLKLF